LLFTCIGLAKDPPPSNDEEILKWTEGMETLEFHDEYKKILDAGATPLFPLVTYKQNSCYRVLYHKVKMPENFVVLGDALCGFNPLYGQGLSTAALGCVTLDAELRKCKNLIGFSNNFHWKMRFRLEFPWLLPRAGDYNYEETVPIKGENKNSFFFLFLRWYVRKVFEMNQRKNKDQKFTSETHTTTAQILNMIDFAGNLFAPKIFLTAMKRQLGL